MNIFFCFKSDFSHLSLLKYLPASIKSFTSIHFTFYISYWQDFTHIHIICSIYIFEPSLPRQHLGNHTVGYCASYFVFFMNKYVNIYSDPPKKVEHLRNRTGLGELDFWYATALPGMFCKYSSHGLWWLKEACERDPMTPLHNPPLPSK